MDNASQKVKRSAARPIGVFDSGIGGLTVLREIASLMPDENLVYLGDTARVPYGTKSPETVRRYSFENASFLISKNVKAIVAACNTASAHAVPALEKAFDLPVLGVIKAGASEAMRRTSSGRIGVIGTYATVKSGRYEELLKANGAVEVISVACPLFVPLAEEGWTDNSIALEIARVYLKPFETGKVDTLILGCTHYPLLQNIIAGVCGPDVQLVNSARAVAVKLKETLSGEKLVNSLASGGKRNYFVTDSVERAREVGSKFLGEDISDNLQLAELSPRFTGGRTDVARGSVPLLPDVARGSVPLLPDVARGSVPLLPDVARVEQKDSTHQGKTICGRK